MSTTTTGRATVDSVLAQPGTSMAANERVLPHAEQDEYECVCQAIAHVSRDRRQRPR